MVAVSTLKNDIDEILPGVIADRRHIHEHPEVAFHELETAKLVAARLPSLGIEDVRTDINGTGVTGLIAGTKPGDEPTRVALLRSEMDGLPVQEETGAEYASHTLGISHACGHDGNIAMLLAVARLLMERRAEFRGSVKVLFQPAEELPPGGAKGMIAQRVLEDPHVDAVIVQGVSLFNDIGTVIVSPGPILAASDIFDIEIHGTGGHAALPHQSVEPILIALEVATAIQTIVSREIDPMERAVVSVTSFHAGSAHIVIPDTAVLRGTVRTCNPDVREFVRRRIAEIVEGITSANRATGSVHYEWGHPVTVNDPDLTRLVQEIATEVVGADNVGPLIPLLGGEDAAYFIQKCPGCHSFIGARNPDKGFVWMHHYPRFDFDEDVLGIGIEMMIRTVLHLLSDADLATESLDS